METCTLTTSHTAAPNIDRCQFLSANGSRCKMTVAPQPPSLCGAHAKSAQARRPEPQSPSGFNPHIARELAPLSGTFRTASDVNRLLGKLLALLLEGRIAHRDAATAGYIVQLILQTLPAQQHEIREVLGFPAWAEAVQSALAADEKSTDIKAMQESESEAAAESETEEERSDSGQTRDDVASGSCSSGPPVPNCATGDLEPVQHATAIDHRVTSNIESSASAGGPVCAPINTPPPVNPEAAPNQANGACTHLSSGPEPDPEPPLRTFRLPGPNGTMQELLVSEECAETAFALRIPPIPRAHPRRS